MNLTVSLKVSLVFILLLFCSEKLPELKEESNEKGSTLKFLNFTRTEYKGIGTKKWTLKAQEAYIYNKKDSQEVQKINLYEIEFHQFLPKKSLIKGEYASLDYLKKKFFVKGNAIFQDDEMELEAASFDYDMEKEILDTQMPVKIKRKTTTIECKRGFFYNKKEDLQICRSPAGNIVPSQRRKEENKFFF